MVHLATPAAKQVRSCELLGTSAWEQFPVNGNVHWGVNPVLELLGATVLLLVLEIMNLIKL